MQKKIKNMKTACHLLAKIDVNIKTKDIQINYAKILQLLFLR